MALDKNSLEKAHAAVTHDPEVNISIYGAEAIIETYLAALPSVSEPVAFEYEFFGGQTITPRWARRVSPDDPRGGWGETLVRNVRPLYTHPAPSEPVSDLVKRLREQIEQAQRELHTYERVGRLTSSALLAVSIEAANAIEHRSLAEGWRPIERADCTKFIADPCGSSKCAGCGRRRAEHPQPPEAK